MENGLSVPALIRYLGPGAARAVLAGINPVDREKFALAAASGEGFSEDDCTEAVEIMTNHIVARGLVAEKGLAGAREVLESGSGIDDVDATLDRVTSLASLPDEDPGLDHCEVGLAFSDVPCVVGARALAYLPAEHAGRVLLRWSDRVAGFAMAMEAAGHFDQMVEALSTLRSDQVGLLIELVADDDILLATHLKARLAGLSELMKLDDLELMRVLELVPIEDLALALLSADEDIRSRCLEHLDAARRSMLSAGLNRKSPVQIREMEEARRVISSVLGHFFEERIMWGASVDFAGVPVN